MILKRADCDAAEWVGGPDTQLKYFKPSKIIRADGDPTLEGMAKPKKTVVLKTSWPGLDRRHNEAKMYQDCNGRFGVMPHVCSYEVTGEYGEVISNILFFPDEDRIGDYYWPIFPSTPPTKFDIRTYNHSILGPNGRQFIHAENPFELSRAWACSLIGTLVVMLWIPSANQALHQGGYLCIYPDTCIGILAWETSY